MVLHAWSSGWRAGGQKLPGVTTLPYTQKYKLTAHWLCVYRLSCPQPQVPKVYWQYSTPEVLVLEYCPGTKINDGPALDAQGLDRQRLARLVVESYLQQILTYGFFHAGEGGRAPAVSGWGLVGLLADIWCSVVLGGRQKVHVCRGLSAGMYGKCWRLQRAVLCVDCGWQV